MSSVNNRNCLLNPIPEHRQAAHLLDKAAHAYCAGNDDHAADLLLRADMKVLYCWCEELWGEGWDYKVQDVPLPLGLKDEDIASRNIPAKIEKEVLSRDGYFCRFCRVPVVCPKSRDLLRKAYPEANGRGALGKQWNHLKNPEKHYAFQALDIQYDHIIPRSRGGPNSVDNVVVACAPCNCGRRGEPLEAVGINNPLDSSPLPGPPNGFKGWDGLTRVLKCRRA